MTIAIGALGGNGVVLGADSGASLVSLAGHAELETSFPVAEKVWAVDGRTIAAAAGSLSSGQYVRLALAEPPLPAGLLAKRREVMTRMARYLGPATRASLLLAGLDDDGHPYLLQACTDAGDVVADHTLGGLAIIGSARLLTEPLAYHHRRPRTLAEATLLVYRLIAEAIRQAVYVKPPVQLLTVTPDGVHRHTPADLAALEARVVRWRTLEREAFERCAREAEAEADEMRRPIPKEVLRA